MDRGNIKQLLDEIKERLYIEEPIKIELKEMKSKAASVSIKRGKIRLNKVVIKELDIEGIRYLIVHELIHYKLKSRYHTEEFQRYINKEIGEEKRIVAEKRIVEILLNINKHRTSIKC